MMIKSPLNLTMQLARTFRQCRCSRLPDCSFSYKTPMHLGAIRHQITASEHKISRKNPPTSTATFKGILPPSLDATAEQPPLFDGTTRLYTSYICPFAQRVWITRNHKGLQEKIKLVPLNLQHRPAWYKDVYPPNKVPSLEHNGKIIGESLDLIKYVDRNFEGPSLFPDDPEKKKFSEELFSYTDTFVTTLFSSFKGDPAKETGSIFNYLENALHKFDDGPFFLGQFSLVDIAYIPFVERFQVFLSEVFKYDPIVGRPKLAAWIEELNKIDAYTQTKIDRKELLELDKARFLGQR